MMPVPAVTIIVPMIYSPFISIVLIFIGILVVVKVALWIWGNLMP